MAVKIAVTPEHEDEERQFHSNRLLLFLSLKKLTALSDIFFNFWKLCTWLFIFVYCIFELCATILVCFFRNGNKNCSVFEHQINNSAWSLYAGFAAFWFFRGSRPVLLGNLIFLWFFRGGGVPDPVPTSLLMKVESIAECSLGAFCNISDLH